MDLRKIKTILELFENSNVAELEISEGESKVRVKRLDAAAAGERAVAATAAVAPPSPAAAIQTAEAAAADDADVVKAPMVGTFYRAADPESEPFVAVGDSVAAGQTICIIEAMKLMNEIPAPRAGVVRRILASNGDAVGFGDPLFAIERE